MLLNLLISKLEHYKENDDLIIKNEILQYPKQINKPFSKENLHYSNPTFLLPKVFTTLLNPILYRRTGYPLAEAAVFLHLASWGKAAPTPLLCNLAQFVSLLRSSSQLVFVYNSFFYSNEPKSQVYQVHSLFHSSLQKNFFLPPPHLL